MKNKSHIYYTYFFIGLFFIASCSKTDSKKGQEEFDSYESRRKNYTINLLPPIIELGETSTLQVKRDKLHLPKMRVFLGDFGEDFNIQDKDTLQYFQGTDSVASTVLWPESSGTKQIQGIIEEYKEISKDSVYSFHYPFEVELIVKDTIDRRSS